MLSEELVRKIKRVHIRGSRLVDDALSGQYRSVFRGQGMEFEEVREYSPGDEVKNIDWKVSARMGRPYVKLFREERERTVMIMADMSASGRFGSGNGSKLDKIVEAAAVLAFSAVKNNDKVGAILFTDHVERYLPPKKGAGHVWRIIKDLLTFEPESRDTNISEALTFLGKARRRRCIGFLISDFICPDYLKSLRVTARRHEMIGVVVHDPGDFRLPPGGMVRMRDLESDRTWVADAKSNRVRSEHAYRAQARLAGTMENLKSAKTDYLELSTGESAAAALARFFRIRERRMK